MPLELILPTDPAARFREIYAALSAERGWSDAAPLRFAAIAAMTCHGSASAVAASIRESAEQIKADAGWFGVLRSQMRFIVAAILLQHEDDVSTFGAEVRRVREMFRAAGVRRDDAFETIAILILRTQHAQHPIEQAAVERLQAIYEEMKRYHWWLTGPDDLPACALLAGRDASPQRIGAQAEEIYQALHTSGFSSGGQLQNAASMLAASDATPHTAAARCTALAAGFREAKVKIWSTDYDELAILAFLDRPAQQVVQRVLHHREGMKALRPKPDRSLTFSLACNVTFLERLQDQNHKLVADAKTLMDMQTIIRARQAAAASAGAS